MENSNAEIPANSRKKMPAEVFVKIWEDGPSAIEGTEWIDSVRFHLDFIGIPIVEFTDVEVMGHIRTPRHYTVGSHLWLVNCLISNIEINNTNDRSFHFYNNTEVGNIAFQNSTIQNITIKDSHLKSISIRNCTIGSLSAVCESKTGNLTIIQSNFFKEIWFKEKSKVERIWISASSEINHIYFEENSLALDLIIEESQIYRITFRDSILRYLRIRSTSLVGKIFLWHSSIIEIKVSEASFLGLFQFFSKIESPPRFVFNKSKIAHLDFNDTAFPEFATLHVTDCEINRLTFNAFCNYGTAFFSNLLPLNNWEEFKTDEKNFPIFKEDSFQFQPATPPETTLHFIDSDLGKIQFINCDLRQFERFEFSNTKMLDVFVAGSQMPDDTAFCLPNDEQNPLKIAEQKRLAYGQFKKIYEARGDIAGSLPYLAYEMEAYRKELNLNPDRSNRGERWMLWLNRYSTNYGNNWLLGARRTSWAVTICYAIFCLCQGIMFNFELKNWGNVVEFFRIVSYAPYYLNPLRDIDTLVPVDDKEINPLARIWDFISRIIVAYFAYQTIQAFRKLGKSSG